MAVERKIYCQFCDCYVGTLRDASLMKGLVYTCVSCQEPADEFISSKDKGESPSFMDNDFMNIFSDIVSGKKR